MQKASLASNLHCHAKQAAMHGWVCKALILRPRILPCMDVSQGDGM